jgi:hypothetical protein
MTSKDFIIWLRGFSEGVHQYNITPIQWETLKEELAKVDDNTIPMGGVIVDHNTFKVNDPGFYPNSSGTTSKGILTTTPGTGYITVANPNIASFGGVSSITTSTATGYPSGTMWSYTITNDKTLLNEVDDDEFDIGGSE